MKTLWTRLIEGGKIIIFTKLVKLVKNKLYLKPTACYLKTSFSFLFRPIL